MAPIPSVVLYTIFFLDFFFFSFFLAVLLGVRKQKFTEPKKYPEISFVVPAYNKEKVLEETIESIKKSDYPQDKIKIIIVDDGSRDRTLQIAKKIAGKYPAVRVFTKKNSGKADSLNYGIKYVNTEIFAVLDADTILQKDLLKKAMIQFEKSSIVAVTSRMKPANHRTLFEKLQGVEYTFTGFYRMLLIKINSLSTAPAFTVFRTEFIRKHGDFDKNNITEDFEMGLRIQSKHYDMGYVSDSCAVTYIPETLKGFYRQRIRWDYGTFYNIKKYRKMFLNKEYGDFGLFATPALLVSLLLVSLVLLLGVYTIVDELIFYGKMFSVGWRPNFSFSFDRFILNLMQPKIILFVFAILTGLLNYLLIRIKIDEPVKIRHYILYLTVYLWIIAVIRVIALGYFIIGKKPEW